MIHHFRYGIPFGGGQARFVAEGIDGVLHDATRSAGKSSPAIVPIGIVANP